MPRRYSAQVDQQAVLDALPSDGSEMNLYDLHAALDAAGQGGAKAQILPLRGEGRIKFRNVGREDGSFETLVFRTDEGVSNG